MLAKRLCRIMAVLVLLATGAAGQAPEITGFVDASWFYDTADPTGEFGVDQVELDVVHRASDRTLVRADLEWLKNGEAYDVQVEQAFIRLIPRPGWLVTFGKFNAPFGFEGYDAPDLYQFSPSLVFTYGLPGNLTGFALGRDLGRGFDLSVFGANGWDSDVQTGGTLTWAGRLEYGREAFLAGLSAISGKEQDDQGDVTRTVLDLDLSYEPEGWVFGAEYNRGRATLASGAEREWSGLLLMARREFTGRLGATVRYDLFDDRDGHVFDEVPGVSQQRQAIALSPSYALDDGLDLILEARVDMSDRDAWLDRDGRPTDRSTTFALEMLYCF